MSNHLSFTRKMELVPGKSIGIVSAQSILSSLTQTVLNQFHSCGSNISAINRGVPRLSELLDLKQTLRYTTYTIASVSARPIEIKALVKLKDLVKSWTCCEPPSWTRYYINQACPPTWGICVILDAPRIINDKILPRTILAPYEMYTSCVLSPTFELFCWAHDLEELEQVHFPLLLDTHLIGMPDVYHVTWTDDKCMATCLTKPQLYTRILELPDVNPLATLSDNIWDIWAKLGIEAARIFLFSELEAIMDPCLLKIHIELLVNHMTWPGTLKSITRYSLRDDRSAVLTKASFEEAMLNFLNAVFYGDVDTLEEVSSTVLTGQRTKVGTGFFELQ